MVLVEIEFGGHTGTGWTYGSRAAATLIEEKVTLRGGA